VRRGTRRTAAAIAALSLLALVTSAPTATAAKRKIDVRPGKEALSKALDRARDGAVLRIHGRRYREAVTIDKRVKLVGVGRRRPVIDARCGSPTTIEVLADGVRLRRLEVVGADTANEVAFDEVSRGRAGNLVVRDTCDALYGINVYDTGPISIANSRARGFDDAGFYVGEIASTPGGAIRVLQSESVKNHRGVIVEDSTSDATIRVANNLIHDNTVPVPGSTPAGIFIHNSDGVQVDENELRRNDIGLHLSSGSDGNVAAYNLFDNPVDVLDEGTGNCGIENLAFTGDALPPC
jgi:nitrous oxidase accessory protein NosD